jgi:purine nucleoside phosphorylase
MEKLTHVTSDIMKPVIAIIGGTGLDDPKDGPVCFTECSECEFKSTPWGESSFIVTGLLDGHKIFILSRHGQLHDKTPTQGTTLTTFSGRTYIVA